MLKFKERIKNDAALPYIDLTEAEKPLYQGAGDALVAVNENGKIINILYINKISDSEKFIEMTKFQKNHALVYQGIMSCFQFCTPQKIVG